MNQLTAQTADYWTRGWQGFFGGLLAIVLIPQIKAGRWKTLLALVASGAVVILVIGISAPPLLNLTGLSGPSAAVP